MFNHGLSPETIKRQLLEKTGGCEYCQYKHIMQLFDFSLYMARERMRHVPYTGGGNQKRFPVEQAAYAIATYKYGDGKKPCTAQRKRRMERSSCKGK